MAILAAPCMLVPSTASAASVPAAVTPATLACQPLAGDACPAYAPMTAGQVLAHSDSVLSTSECEQQLGRACYTDAQLRRAYGLDSLARLGITGAGQTVMIVDMIGSPTLEHDANVAARANGLPPVQLTVVHYDGSPAWDYSDPGVQSWALETSADVQAVHAAAPDAKIVVVEPDPSGFAPMPAALESALKRFPKTTVVSFSFGAVEGDFFDGSGYSALNSLRYAFTYASARHTTLVASTGDWGAAQVEDDGSLSANPATAWPATDPDVVAVGGTSVHLDDQGRRLGPDTTWNDAHGASGGGLSAAFGRPAYQNAVSSVVGGQRGVPDISLTADPDGGTWVYESFTATPQWVIFGGTSEAAPLFAGMVALAAQKARHPLGAVNSALYNLASQGYSPRTGLVQVAEGDNSWGGVTGYPAGPGYDLATGIGTVDAASLVPELALHSAAR